MCRSASACWLLAFGTTGFESGLCLSSSPEPLVSANGPRVGVTDREVETILNTAFEAAARRNPLLLYYRQPDALLGIAREVIRDCGERGVARDVIIHIVVDRLLNEPPTAQSPPTLS
jgi:hypothetical protein